MANLRVLAVGDSVVWGQGLQHNDKFVSLFYRAATGAAWPQENLPAHSGAIIGVGKLGSPIPADQVPDRGARGEVPFSFPTILEQVRSVGEVEAKNTDVLILNGGINDVNFRSILLEPLLGPESILEGAIRKYCYDHMLLLLKEARQRFPHAVIIALGYYPILSTRSDLDQIKAFLVLHSIFAALPDLVAKKAARNVLYFHHRQIYWIRRAVAEVNQDRLLRGQGILFVHPTFGPDNSVGAGDPFLFQPKRPANLTAWSDGILDAITRKDYELLSTLLLEIEPQEANNAVALKRRLACDVVNSDNWGERMQCRVAPIGHPNEKGAQRYADAIKGRFDQHQRLPVKAHLSRLMGAAGPISVRKALGRYGLRLQDGLRACMQQMTVDCLEVVIKTRNEDYAGTDDFVFLQVGDGWRWRLNETIFDLQLTNEFEKGSTGTYTIDPILDSNRGPLHLGEIKEITLIKEKAGLPGGDWKPEQIIVQINGLDVFQSAINAELTDAKPRWTATDPSYPRTL